jgi:hypothetical protein
MLDTFFRSSPSISSASAAMVPSGVSQLMAHRKQEPNVFSLTPSLANYVNPKLMEHVSGWLTDPLEVQVCLTFPYVLRLTMHWNFLQANKLAEEAHTIGSIGCAQVSAELKQARSLVRITEIEATLQEQRWAFSLWIKFLEYCTKRKGMYSM